MLVSLVPFLLASAGTITQSANGLNCSSNCINGVCTNTCTDQGAMYKGNGDITAKEFAFKGFDAVLAKNIEIWLRYDQEYSVLVEADSNLLEKVMIKQAGKELTVSLEDGSYENASFKVKVGLPLLSVLELNSVESSRIESFDQADLSISLQGVANVHGVNNHITELHYAASGVTALNFSKSKVENAQLDVDGTSDVRLSFSGSGVLEGIVQGVSTLVYCGNPDKQLQTHGIADVRRLDC